MINKVLFSLVLFSVAFSMYGQSYLLPNEEVVYFFTTKNKKKVVLAQDKKGKYLVYRFGTERKIELEYPEVKNEESWKKFKYSHYSRGGGVKNSAMELSNVSFTNNGFEYRIYDTYLVEGNEKRTGIYVINLSTDKKTAIPGMVDTKRGNMAKLQQTPVEKGDEIYN